MSSTSAAHIPARLERQRKNPARCAAVLQPGTSALWIRLMVACGGYAKRWSSRWGDTQPGTGWKRSVGWLTGGQGTAGSRKLERLRTWPTSRGSRPSVSGTHRKRGDHSERRRNLNREEGYYAAVVSGRLSRRGFLRFGSSAVSASAMGLLVVDPARRLGRPTVSIWPGCSPMPTSPLPTTKPPPSSPPSCQFRSVGRGDTGTIAASTRRVGH